MCHLSSYCFFFSGVLIFRTNPSGIIHTSTHTAVLLQQRSWCCSVRQPLPALYQVGVVRGGSRTKYSTICTLFFVYDSVLFGCYNMPALCGVLVLLCSCFFVCDTLRGSTLPCIQQLHDCCERIMLGVRIMISYHTTGRTGATTTRTAAVLLTRTITAAAVVSRGGVVAAAGAILLKYLIFTRYCCTIIN